MMLFEDCELAVGIGQVPCSEYALGIGGTSDDPPSFDVIDCLGGSLLQREPFRHVHAALQHLILGSQVLEPA
jgi:hypothetical protein